ncbi:ATP-binding cassette domain-containing protein [bacterium]|nr:ATP-binding cassette domain-containing protein [bacterium]
MLELKNIQIVLQDKDLFPSLSLSIKPGEVATIMGPSGCGKSTLLAAICGNLPEVFTLKGDILLEQQSILETPMENRKIGLLFQDDLLFPHMDIAGNLGFAIPAEISKQERKRRISNALTQAGLTGLEKRDPSTLSGGQRARVSLLRALLAEPKALLLDEPFSKMDQQLKGIIREFVFEQIRTMKIPTLLVTHDPNDCPNGQRLDLI